MTAPLTVETFLRPVARTPEPARRPSHDPLREIAIGGSLAALLVIGFVGWAAVTRLDAAVISPGTIRVPDGRLVAQTPVTGTVSTVRVHNGDRVAAGQVLIEFTTGDAVAQERSLAARVFGLQAEIARVDAEFRGTGRVDANAAFGAVAPADREIATQALAMEQAQLDAQRALEASERAVMRDRGAQVVHQIAGTQQRLSSTQRQGSLNGEELRTYEDLYARGFATKPRVLALRRAAAAFDGDAGATVAEIARLRAQGSEARLQLMQLKSERATQNAERSRAVHTELATVLPQWQAARDQLRQTIIRAGVAGTVTAMQSVTPGAVFSAGARLLEIVPSDRGVVVEAKVSLADANDLRVGQLAQVRLSALRGRLLPTLQGKVTRVSADSVEDERTGQAFYTATITVAAAEVARVARLGEVEGGLRVGTPVEVVVPTKRRSALDFLVGPLTARMSGSFAQR